MFELVHRLCLDLTSNILFLWIKASR